MAENYYRPKLSVEDSKVFGRLLSKIKTEDIHELLLIGRLQKGMYKYLAVETGESIPELKKQMVGDWDNYDWDSVLQGVNDYVAEHTSISSKSKE